MVIEELDHAGAGRELAVLAGIMRACVEGGARVNFVRPFAQADSEAWWRRNVLPAMEAGEKRLLVARVDGTIRGSVQLVHAGQPNQAHRADVAKLLVDPAARRMGIGRALMTRIEAIARDSGRRLLTLDTVEDSAAYHLYRSLGWSLLGVVPRFALSPDHARLEGSAFFWKEIG
jgi:ribosomal protein S18 acetylase RimI-like enzyme